MPRVGYGCLRSAAGLFRARRNLDPDLGTRGHGRIVGLRAGTVVPGRLQLLVHNNGRRLYHDLRWVIVRRIVVRRITPPRTPPGAGHDDAVPMKVAVESVVPVETVAPMASAAMPPGDDWPCGNDQEREREEGRYNYPTHTAYLGCLPLSCVSQTEHRRPVKPCVKARRSRRSLG